jgi:hypothetical protein
MKLLNRFQFVWFAMVMAYFVFLAACTGPRPSASVPKVFPPSSAGEPYHVSFEVKNDGSGEGQVEVNVRLHEKNQQATYFADQKLNLKSHEIVHVIVSVPAPPGDYAAEATAEYPPG